MQRIPMCACAFLLIRGSCVWPVHHSAHHRHYPVVHRIPRPLLPHCVQAQLHHPQHFLWWELFHCGWHLLWAWSSRHQRWQVRDTAFCYSTTRFCLSCTQSIRGIDWVINVIDRTINQWQRYLIWLHQNFDVTFQDIPTCLACRLWLFLLDYFC